MDKTKKGKLKITIAINFALEIIDDDTFKITEYDYIIKRHGKETKEKSYELFISEMLDSYMPYLTSKGNRTLALTYNRP